MTAQITDTFVYEGEERYLAGVKGGELFDPRKHGVRTRMISTACWAGYYCRYEIDGGILYLQQINLGLEPVQVATTRLFGRVPESYMEEYRVLRDKDWETVREPASDYRIAGLREPMDFTGGLLLGGDFIDEMYEHMGFHPAQAYRKVHELIFAGGQLKVAHDRSAEMATFREMLAKNPDVDPRGLSGRGLSDWIAERFSQKY